MATRPYELGDPQLNQQIRELIDAAGDDVDGDLIGEIVTTAIKLMRDGADRGDLKLVNTALKEMRYSMLVFSRYRDTPKVTIYGSARVPPGDANYELTKKFARMMVQERNWMVVTGAGPGIMQAGNEGAGPDATFGVNIRLPFEADANTHVPPERLINFKYFFTRKLFFVKESHAFVMMPGGFGTMDEAFELLTLVQTGKSDIKPIVMLEAEGGSYWSTWLDFIRGDLLEEGLISEHDLSLFTITSDPQVAAEEVCAFYTNYQSQRYVGSRLVLRLNKAPDQEELRALNEQFGDIVVEGRIEVIGPTPAEQADGDSLDAERVALRFDRRSFGRLRQFIDALNELAVEAPREVHPPRPFTEEQQERPW